MPLERSKATWSEITRRWPFLGGEGSSKVNEILDLFYPPPVMDPYKATLSPCGVSIADRSKWPYDKFVSAMDALCEISSKLPPGQSKTLVNFETEIWKMNLPYNKKKWRILIDILGYHNVFGAELRDQILLKIQRAKRSSGQKGEPKIEDSVEPEYPEQTRQADIVSLSDLSDKELPETQPEADHIEVLDASFTRRNSQLMGKQRRVSIKHSSKRLNVPEQLHGVSVGKFSQLLDRVYRTAEHQELNLRKKNDWVAKFCQVNPQSQALLWASVLLNPSVDECDAKPVRCNSIDSSLLLVSLATVACCQYVIEADQVVPTFWTKALQGASEFVHSPVRMHLLIQ